MYLIREGDVDLVDSRGRVDIEKGLLDDFEGARLLETHKFDKKGNDIVFDGIGVLCEEDILEDT